MPIKITAGHTLKQAMSAILKMKPMPLEGFQEVPSEETLLCSEGEYMLDGPRTLARYRGVKNLVSCIYVHIIDGNNHEDFFVAHVNYRRGISFIEA